MPDISHSVKYTLEVAGAAAATSELQRVGGAATSSTGAATGLSGAFGGLAGQFAAGNLMAQAATQAIGALKQAVQQLLTDAISLTVEMADLTDAMGYIYEDAAPQLIDNLDAISASSGYARSELYGLTRDIGAMIAPMGLSSDAAADMSSNIVRASADAAAALGMDLSQASGAMEAALRGSSRAARQLGIDISEDAIAAELLSMGVTTAASATDEATLIQARYNIAMEATARYAGAAAAEMDTLEGAQRSLATTYENMAASLGDSIAPLMQTFVNTLESLIPLITFLAETSMATFAFNMAPVSVILTLIGEVTSLAGDALRELAESIGLTITPAEALGIATGWLNDKIREILDALRELLGIMPIETVALETQAEATEALASAMNILKGGVDGLTLSQILLAESAIRASIAEIELKAATGDNATWVAAQERIDALTASINTLDESRQALKDSGFTPGPIIPSSSGGSGGTIDPETQSKKQAQIQLYAERLRLETNFYESSKELQTEAFEEEQAFQEMLIEKRNEEAEEEYELRRQRNEEIASSVVDAFGVAMTDFEHFDEYVTDAIKKWAVEMMKAFAIEGLTNLLTGGMGGGLKSLGKFVK